MVVATVSRELTLNRFYPLSPPSSSPFISYKTTKPHQHLSLFSLIILLTIIVQGGPSRFPAPIMKTQHHNYYVHQLGFLILLERDDGHSNCLQYQHAHLDHMNTTCNRGVLYGCGPFESLCRKNIRVKKGTIKCDV